YKKVVARHYFYTETDRITINIGIKNDLFKKKGKREFYYKVFKTPLNAPPSKKLGRPKGSRNKSKKKKNSVKKKTRGRRGLFTVFYKGKRGYTKVDPYRMTLKFSKNMDPKIVATLKELFGLFSRKTIQNNVGEGSNSVKTESSVEKKIRAFVIVRNEPELLYKIQIDRNTRGNFIINDLISPELAQLMC
ncbi:MAG: hypothetical protein ACTSRI_03610, partial [Promethearchaeota archaeon]